MIYVKGIASMNVIKEIKLKSPNNKFYQCSTPDGYSGFVLAGHLINIYIVENHLQFMVYVIHLGD